MSGTVVVIGGGTNALVAAHVLAGAGRQVIMLDDGLPPGLDFDAGWVPPAVLGALRLNLGVEEMPDERFAPETIRKHSARDAGRWPEFTDRMRRLASVLEALYQQPAPDVETTDPGELMRLALLGLKVRGLGKQTIIDLLRILPMSVAELLDDWFESEELKAAIGAAGVLDQRLGPRSGGTAFVLLHHHVGRPAGVFRPARTSLRTLLEERGGIELRRGTRVARILVAGERATGVVTASGETIATDCVVSAADPRRTLLDLVEPGWLDPEFMRAVGNIRMRGVTAQVTLHADWTPTVRMMTLAPSLTAMEKAYDSVKYGAMSPEPWLEIRAGAKRVDVDVQYVPATMRDGATLGADVTRRVMAAIPALQGRVSGADVLTPHDLEQQCGLTGGHRYQGELGLDQILFMRPVAGWSRYRTPIAGLWLCGAGSHPGGAVAGAAGWLAAREVLKADA